VYATLIELSSMLTVKSNSIPLVLVVSHVYSSEETIDGALADIEIVPFLLNNPSNTYSIVYDIAPIIPPSTSVRNGNLKNVELVDEVTTTSAIIVSLIYVPVPETSGTYLGNNDEGPDNTADLSDLILEHAILGLVKYNCG
jgi:hypothetical protein